MHVAFLMTSPFECLYYHHKINSYAFARRNNKWRNPFMNKRTLSFLHLNEECMKQAFEKFKYILCSTHTDRDHK